MDIKLLLSAFLFVLIDFFYLSSVSKYFNKQVSLIQGSPLKLEPYSTMLCYIFLVFGLYYFILRENRSVFDAFLFGLVIYMVYETTNKAIFKEWSWTTVLLDGAWGGILYASTTAATYYIYNNYLV